MKDFYTTANVTFTRDVNLSVMILVNNLLVDKFFARGVWLGAMELSKSESWLVWKLDGGRFLHSYYDKRAQLFTLGLGRICSEVLIFMKRL